MIYLVGTNHHDKRHDENIRKYVQKASRKECAVFLEGFSADSKKARQLAQQAYQIKDGWIFGYESEIANALCGVLLHLGYCRATGMQNEARMGNLQTCYDITTIDAVRTAWDKISVDLPLCVKIDSILQTKKHFDSKQLVNFIHQNHKHILDSREWVQLYQQLFRFLKELVPNEFRVQLDDQRVLTYLESNRNAEQDYIVNEINIKWRNQFIVHNISSTIQLEQLNGIEIYIFIGAGHVREILVPLMNLLGGIQNVDDPMKLP